MREPPTNGDSASRSSPGTATANDQKPVQIDLVAEAEALRAVLTDASNRIGRLLSALKQRRRQSRAVQQAMESLHQLKLDGC